MSALFGVELERGEAASLLLLLLLYTLQGVPMGISSSVSFILQEKGVSYAEQGTFSLASWPFSLKLIWAPLVDALYVRRWGQRRTWVMPLQTAVGLLLLYMASHISELLGEHDVAVTPSVTPLTVIFFIIYFLLASQDIAVDGWAITMLSKRNVGLASTANAVGQTAGLVISFTGYLVLNSWGLVGLGGFLRFWGAVFLVSAGLVLFTFEKPSTQRISVVDAYAQAVSVLRLPCIRDVSAVLLTRNAAFAAAESLTQLRLLDKGIPKQHMATVLALISPLNMMVPMLAAKWTSGARPMDALTSTFKFRAALSLGAAVLLATAPAGLGTKMPLWYYTAVTMWLALYSSVGTLHFVAVMAFFNRVADPVLGGTYMTLLNTVGNLGSKWCSSGVLFLFSALSAHVPRHCTALVDGALLGVCADDSGGGGGSTTAQCHDAGGRCVSDSDPYFHALCVVSFVLGCVWIWTFQPRIARLQDMPLHKWRVSK